MCKVAQLDASSDEVEVACKLFERLEKQEHQHDKDKSNENWQQWVRSSLADGARKAHRWSNAPNNNAPDIHVEGVHLPMDVVRKETDRWRQVW